MRRRLGIAALAAVLLAGGLLWGLAARREPVLTVGVYAGSYWQTPNGDCYQILDDAIALFQEAHPGVRVEYVSGIPTDDYSEWLAGRILKGTGLPSSPRKRLEMITSRASSACTGCRNALRLLIVFSSLSSPAPPGR